MFCLDWTYSLKIITVSCVNWIFLSCYRKSNRKLSSAFIFLLFSHLNKCVHFALWDISRETIYIWLISNSTIFANTANVRTGIWLCVHFKYSIILFCSIQSDIRDTIKSLEIEMLFIIYTRACFITIRNTSEVR